MSVIAQATKALLKPVVQYLDDETVSEIMINGRDQIYIERKGKIYKVNDHFETDDELMAAIRSVAQYMGRVINEERPTLDARLPDGSRIHIVIPPCARRGAYMSIRKFSRGKLSIKDLISFGSMSLECAKFLKLAIELKKNIVVSGGTSSGKTTLLNVISSLIPHTERIITIEDSAELQLQQEHVVPMETKAPDKDGKGGISLRSNYNWRSSGRRSTRSLASNEYGP